MNEIAVIVPTFQRPESLERALRSVFAQEGLAALAAELVVVDNDPDGGARAVVDRLRADSPAPLLYVHAREPGVSNARNAGLAACTAPLIAFLDDDEAAPPHWLGALRAAHLGLGADVTFGPVHGRADAAAAWKRPYLDRFFSRVGPRDSGVVDAVFGCGNAMLTRATTLSGPAPFDPRANATGGEDDRLFQALIAEGRRFAWAADAWVWEHAAPERQSVRYALARAVGYGQTPAQIAARRGDWPAVARWMAVGAAQAVGFGLAAAGLATVSPARALPRLDRAARGLGKLVWFRTLRFYAAPTPGGGTTRAAARTAASLPSGTARRNAMAAKITHSRSL